MQDKNTNECELKTTPAIDQMISRVSDAIGRVDDMRARIAQRNDRLFGCVPCDVDGSKEDVADGSINQLDHNIETLHHRLSLLDDEMARQANLA